jgi:hypothetical protein
MSPPSIDFILTNFYRRAWADLVAIYDVWSFCSKKQGATGEFRQLLANLAYVEHRSFKKSKFKFRSELADKEEVPEASTIILWEYYRDIIFTYWLDDLTQYPFWSAKILVVSHHEEFGLHVVEHLFETIGKIFTEQGFMSLFVGAIPYLAGSMICNFDELSRATHRFFMDSLASMPGSMQSVGSMMNLLGAGSSSNNLMGGPNAMQSMDNTNNVESRTARSGSVAMREMEMEPPVFAVSSSEK